ncbi:MAG: hypothetical protein MJ252_25635 [archaeon]|nr:hypothetical protein [archaeon]
MCLISLGSFRKISIFALYSAGIKTIRYFIYPIFHINNPSPLLVVFIDGFSQTFAIIFEIIFNNDNSKVNIIPEDQAQTRTLSGAIAPEDNKDSLFD